MKSFSVVLILFLVQCLLPIEQTWGFSLGLLLSSQTKSFGFVHPISTRRPITSLILKQQRQDDNNEEVEKSSRGEKAGDSSNKKTDNNNDGTTTNPSSGGFFSSILARAKRSRENSSTTTEATIGGATSTLTPVITTTTTTTTESTTKPNNSRGSELSPVERAAQFKAQAEKARLEADRMEAELTLQKIERIERELKHAKAKGTVEAVEKLQKDMTVLIAKLNGESPQPTLVPQKKKTSSSSSVKDMKNEPPRGPTSSSGGPGPSDAPPKGDFFSSLPSVTEPFDQEKFNEVLNSFNEMPEIMKKVTCRQIGLEIPKEGPINSTNVALLLDAIRRFDFDFQDGERPSFTRQDIETMQKRLQTGSNWLSDDASGYVADERFIRAAAGNQTELALLCLEYEYYQMKFVLKGFDDPNFLIEDEEVVAAIEQMASDGAIISALPPCTRKEGKEPTLEQAQMIFKDVLPKVQFTSSSKPLACPGGYIIKGKSRASNGDTLIRAIDAQLQKIPALKDKVTVCYMMDISLPGGWENMFLLGGEEDDEGEMVYDGNSEIMGTILFVGGADIAREPRKVALSLVSMSGLATCWYFSLYPFLLNPALANRIDEQLALVDANMAADFSWLTDMSYPLFVTFIGLQLLHELAHRIVASFNSIKPTFPTFVPSIITGVTSVTTSFKEPPKNLRALTDFSLAGPLVGMLASAVAILVGSQLTVMGGADAVATFPALPLEILRQSWLGGGIVEAVLGSGILAVPDAARGTAAVAAMTIPLHPIAVAGYVSLLVNALSMIPIGTTDGGRVAMALFGRVYKQIIGAWAFWTLLILGIQGKDLFLFYFAFCLAFQKGNEIPCRNEVDSVDMTRTIVAAATFLLALSALIPFQ